MSGEVAVIISVLLTFAFYNYFLIRAEKTDRRLSELYRELIEKYKDLLERISDKIDD